MQRRKTSSFFVSKSGSFAAVCGVGVGGRQRDPFRLHLSTTPGSCQSQDRPRHHFLTPPFPHWSLTVRHTIFSFSFRLAFRKWVFFLMIKTDSLEKRPPAADTFANGTRRRDAASARWDRTAWEIPAATSPATTAAPQSRTSPETVTSTRTNPTRGDLRDHPWGEAPGTPTASPLARARPFASATSRRGSLPLRAIASAPPPRARGPRPRRGARRAPTRRRENLASSPSMLAAKRFAKRLNPPSRRPSPRCAARGRTRRARTSSREANRRGAKREATGTATANGGRRVVGSSGHPPSRRVRVRVRVRIRVRPPPPRRARAGRRRRRGVRSVDRRLYARG